MKLKNVRRNRAVSSYGRVLGLKYSTFKIYYIYIVAAVGALSPARNVLMKKCLHYSFQQTSSIIADDATREELFCAISSSFVVVIPKEKYQSHGRD